MIGRIHSLQSLGTVDGPGVRFVVFMQGCPLRCGCCHNPDTWDFAGGEEYAAVQIAEKIERYKEYFGDDGGVTVSGGEPLMQAEFVRELFGLCHERGINTCLDTSGCVINDEVRALLSVTDRVLLDVKYTDPELYIKHVGCDYGGVLNFLDLLEEMKIPTILRQVIIPTLNDNEENIQRLKAIVHRHSNVEGVELLPFRKICSQKYDNMGIEFKFGHLREPDGETMRRLNEILRK